MADGAEACEFRCADLRLIGEGGTRRVYGHPDHPGVVFKRFREPPSPTYLEALRDTHEFSSYLLGQARLVEARLTDGQHCWRETIIEQPRCAPLRDALPICISYWELRSDLPRGASKERELGKAGDLALGHETVAPALLQACRERPAFVTALAEFHERVLAYVGRTGMLFDFAGSGNVLAIRHAGREIEVIDGIKGDVLPDLALSSARPAVPTVQETAALINACAFFRALCLIERLTGLAPLESLYAPWDACLSELCGPSHRDNVEHLRVLHAALGGEIRQGTPKYEGDHLS